MVGFPTWKVDVPGLNKGDLQSIVEDVTSALKDTHVRAGWIHSRRSPIAHPSLSSADPTILLLECSLSTLAVPHGRQWSFPTSMDTLLLPMVADLQGKPETKHDMASLAFTIASLLAGGSVPWFGFSG